MTISSQTRKAGPFTGNGVTKAFPFAFKVFSATDLLVVRANIAGVESTLVLGTDYTVSINADQNSNPGGTVTLTTALASGFALSMTSQVPLTQATDLTNQGGFYPQVITTSLDKLTILTQQLNEQVSRAAKVPITSPADAATLVGNINLLAQNLSILQSVNGNQTNITTVAGNTPNINTVAVNNANVTTVAGSITAVNTNSANITAIQNASANANAAAASASAASASASTATTQATNSASSAAASANSASASAASASASQTSRLASEAARDAAQASQTAAASSASAASASQSGAATSAANSATSATQSATSATNSANSATASASSASASQTSRLASEAARDAAQASQTAAANSASAAAASASNAASSATASASSATNAASSLSSFRGIYIGASATAPTVDGNGNPLAAGDLYFNTTTNSMQVFGSSGWTAAGSSVNGTSRRFRFIASAGQTSFSGVDSNGATLAYDSGFIDVYLNGVRLDQTDFTATSGTSVVLASGAAASDELHIVAFGTFSVATAVAKTGDTMSGPLALTGGGGASPVSVRQTRFGYSSSYSVLQLGTESAGQAVSLFVDPSSNPSGSFNGNGRELLVPQNFSVIAPSASNTSFKNVLQFDDGRVTMPNQPTFRAFKANSQSISGGVASNKLTLSPQIDIGSGWQSSNNRWFAPVSGYYLVYCQAYFGSNTDGYWGAAVAVNGSTPNGYVYFRGGFGDISGVGTNIVYLNGGTDYIEMWVYPVTTTTMPATTATFMMARLLG